MSSLVIGLMVTSNGSADTGTEVPRNDTFVTIAEKDSKKNLNGMQNKNANCNSSINWNKKLVTYF